MSKLPPKPWADTYVFGGIQRIFRIWEDMRARNTDGYVPTANGGGILANIDPHGGLRVVPGTTCSPFTATVIGLAFDPTYPRDDLPAPSKGVKGGDAYKPMFNGGKDRLPFTSFYVQHNNNNQPIEAIVDYGLGKVVDKTEMRRGDCLGIAWANGKGHAVWCWDVHLDEHGKVDAFQYLGANASKGNEGVTIGHCCYGPWIKGTPKLYRDAHPDQKFSGLENARAPEPVFKDEDLVVQKGQWLVLPGIPEGSIDLSTFRVRPELVSYSKPGTFTVGDVKVGRLNYKDPVPEPYCMKKGGAAGMKGSQASKPQVVAPPPVVVPKAQVKKDPEATKKIEPKPAVQDAKKPLSSQLEVENALQIFFNAGWIKSDPGKPDAINDDQSKKAIKEYQTLFDLLVDGIVGKQTLGSVRQQLGPAITHAVSQLLLTQLYRGKKLSNDPGPVDGKNHDQCRKAVEEFQGANGLKKTGVPDAETAEKLRAALDEHAPSEAKPGLVPEVKHLFWVGNSVEPGGTATLQLHANDLKVDQQCPVTLLDADGKEYESTAKIKVSGKQGETLIAIPKEFGLGAKVFAKVVAELEDGELEAKTGAPLIVRAKGGGKTETADWRPYIGKDAVPDDVLETVRRNRALYAPRNLVLVSGKYAGKDHYDYKPPNSHAAWAKAYFQKKVDAAAEGTPKKITGAFMLMLDAEGRPASLQTYDNQIVTWGVGLGAKGDGVHAFEQMNKDPQMKKLLDDLGINYERHEYHVVDLKAKKVVSTAPGKAGDDDRHIPPLRAWRYQTDLLSAVIGISEDPATREAVAESQYAVYLSNSTQWPGKDKVFTVALFFMIVHLHHWMPGIAKYGFNVEKLFAAIGGGTPSIETDKKLAQRVANAFVKRAKWHFITSQKDPNKYKDTYDDIHTRTKTRVWEKLKEDGKREGLAPGPLVYDE